MGAYLSWFHLAVLFALLAIVQAAIATAVLGTFLRALEARHADVWRRLGEPRLAAPAPGAGPALFRFLRDGGYRSLEPAVGARARQAFVMGLVALLDGVVALVFVVLLLADVEMPQFLSRIPVPF
jgi:hypothetical protein